MVSAPEPALYVGQVRHRRRLPKAHAFTYPLFMAFLDVDRIPELCRVSRFLSYGRWNWAAFHEADQFGDPALPLRERLRRDAEAKGHQLPGGPIFLLTHLRYLGICFNPVSYFYCHDEAGALALIMAQVSNTPWRERHTYWMPVVEGHQGPGGVSFDVAKAFHVSPFMPMDCRYRWAFTAPGDRLRVHIAEFHGPDLFFEASLDLRKQPWTGGIVRKTLVQFPWMTLKVLTAIHWEALWLWIKRVPVFTHPGPSKPPPSPPPASPSASC
jgi:DUF1365 family protein